MATNFKAGDVVTTNAENVNSGGLKMDVTSAAENKDVVCKYLDRVTNRFIIESFPAACLHLVKSGS